MKITYHTLKTGFSYRLMDSRWAICSQPQPEDFKELKEQSFTRVINVRNTRELEKLDFDVSKTVQGLNFKYHHIPILKEGDLDEGALGKIHQLLSFSDKETEGKTIIHCAAGQRAAVALLVHLLQSGQVSDPSVAPLAVELGLQREDLLNRILQIVKK